MEFFNFSYKKQQKIFDFMYDACIKNNICLCKKNYIHSNFDFKKCIHCYNKKIDNHKEHILTNNIYTDCEYCIKEIIKEKKQLLNKIELEETYGNYDTAEKLYDIFFQSYKSIINKYFPNTKKKFIICCYKNKNYKRVIDFVEIMNEYNYLDNSLLNILLTCYNLYNINILSKQYLLNYSKDNYVAIYSIVNTLIKSNPCATLKYLYDYNLQGLFEANCLHIISNIFDNSHHNDNYMTLETRQIISTCNFEKLPNENYIKEKIYIYKTTGIVPKNLNHLLEFQTAISLAENPKQIDFSARRVYEIVLIPRLIKYIVGFLFI